MKIDIRQGNSLELLKTLSDNSVDAVVTDPPYELGFMGKSWDKTGIANNVELWKECLRVLKPGGHLLAFSGTRTYHRMACAIEDAGFEVRDMIEWVYGSGMSKGNVWNKGKQRTSERLNKENDIMVENGYEGWGNVGMKPAHEPIAFCRKPIEKGLTVAENCLKWGVGGINVDESRVESNEKIETGRAGRTSTSRFNASIGEKQLTHSERFPANLITDGSEEVRVCFPETKSGSKPGQKGKSIIGSENGETRQEIENAYGDSGNASRFFKAIPIEDDTHYKSIIYQAKASKKERNAGCEGFDKKQVFGDEGGTYQGLSNSKYPSHNFHPTIKSISLMEYLIKMITPKGGIVLDPFMGSGSTGCACVKNGYSFIGFDLTPEYVEIAKARINYYYKENLNKLI